MIRLYTRWETLTHLYSPIIVIAARCRCCCTMWRSLSAGVRCRRVQKHCLHSKQDSRHGRSEPCRHSSARPRGNHVDVGPLQ